MPRGIDGVALMAQSDYVWEKGIGGIGVPSTLAQARVIMDALDYSRGTLMGPTNAHAYGKVVERMKHAIDILRRKEAAAIVRKG